MVSITECHAFYREGKMVDIVIHDPMSDEFDSVDAIEKAALQGALDRCRALAAHIESELCSKKPEHFIDELSLADFYASLECAADVLGQKGRRPSSQVPAVKGNVP
jgi:hypothetical protein